MARAVVLLSGGMDSATALAVAKYNSCSCFALTIDYGQRNQYEIKAAESVAKHMDVLEHKILHFDLTDFGGSALTDKTYPVPVEETSGIPITYVPARNTIFFSFALAWSEVIDAEYIYSGVNAVDYSGYPDCRPKYIEAMQKLINLATKKTIEGNTILIKTPLINLTKAEIILLGLEKGVDFSKTVSCYQITEDGKSCGVCDACRLRIQAFKEVQIEDRIDYV